MSKTKQKKTYVPKVSEQTNKLAEAVLLLSQEIQILKQDIATLGKYAHHHPDAPVLGHVPEPVNEKQEAWIKTSFEAFDRANDE